MVFPAFVLYYTSCNILSFYLDKVKSSFILRCINTHLDGSAVIKILLLIFKGNIKILC